MTEVTGAIGKGPGWNGLSRAIMDIELRRQPHADATVNAMEIVRLVSVSNVVFGSRRLPLVAEVAHLMRAYRKV